MRAIFLVPHSSVLHAASHLEKPRWAIQCEKTLTDTHLYIELCTVLSSDSITVLILAE